MTEDKKKIINELVEKNTEQGNLLKAVEELSELSTALIQYLVKEENKEKQLKSVIDEIGDVEIRLNILRKIFGEEEVDNRISFKLNKFSEYIDKGLYSGRI